MGLYIKFIVSLTFGLVGLGMVLTVLLDTIFNEWDAFNDIIGRVSFALSGKGARMEHIRAEDILLEAEKQSGARVNIRLVDQRRRQIQEMEEIESQVSRGAASPAVTDLGILPS